MKSLIKVLLNELLILPKQFKKNFLKSKILALRNKFHKEFYKKKLKYDNKYHFYYLDPMPTESFLGDYYNSVYWKMRPERIEKNFVRDKDFRHIDLIQKHIFNFLGNKKCNILNFGSGHAGVSLLLRSNNHTVYNFDYITPKEKFFNDNYYFIDDFDKINNDLKFDIIYSSHALEHVTDILSLLKKFQNVSHSETFYFFEVPNGFNQNEIRPPHTLYFTRNFFGTFFEKKNEESKVYINYIYKDNKEILEDVKGGVINLITNNKMNI